MVAARLDKPTHRPLFLTAKDRIPYGFRDVSPFQVRCGLVLISSGIDAFLAYYYRAHILDLERNPVCLSLMEMEPNHLSVFIVAKLIATISVVAIMCLVKRWHEQMGRLIANVFALFQMGLLTYQITI